MPWENLGSGHQIAWHALYGCQCNFGTTSIYSAYTFNLGNLEYEWNFKGSAFEELLNSSFDLGLQIVANSKIL